MKDSVAFIFSSWVTCSGGSQLPFRVMRTFNSMRCPHGGEPSHLLGNSVTWQPSERAILAADPASPVKPSDEESQHLDCNPGKEPESKPPN